MVFPGRMRGADQVRIAVLALVLGGCADGGGNGSGATPQLEAPAPERIELATSLGVNADSMTELAGGVRIQDLRVGSGAVVSDSTAVRVEYRAWLPDGTLYEQRPSADGFGASEFVVGTESAPVPGVSAGLIGMKAGGVRRILVPADLGYGLIGRPSNVPENSPLLFEVTLLSVR